MKKIISSLFSTTNDATPKESGSTEESPDFLSPFKTNTVYDIHTNESLTKEYYPEETISYWLPKDEDEQQRLTGQHFAVKELLEGNFLPKVHEVINFNKELRILDVGCGSGIWLMDMATEYPNCSYKGCDIIDLVYKNVNLEQIDISFGNVAEGLNYPDNYFDFVHMRLLVLALRKEEWPLAIKELLRVTKPGGIFHLFEFASKKNGGPAAQKFLEAGDMVCYARGQDPNIADRLEEMINEIGGSKIIQSEYFSVNLSDDSSLSKKFRWDWEETAAGVISILGPLVGLNTKEEQKKFLEDLHEDYLTTNSHIYMKAVAAQKL